MSPNYRSIGVKGLGYQTGRPSTPTAILLTSSVEAVGLPSSKAVRGRVISEVTQVRAIAVHHVYLRVPVSVGDKNDSAAGGGASMRCAWQLDTILHD